MYGGDVTKYWHKQPTIICLRNLSAFLVRAPVALVLTPGLQVTIFRGSESCQWYWTVTWHLKQYTNSLDFSDNFRELDIRINIKVVNTQSSARLSNFSPEMVPTG